MSLRELPKSSVRKSVTRRAWSFDASRHTLQVPFSSAVFPLHFGHFWGFGSLPEEPQLSQYQTSWPFLHCVGMSVASMSKMSSAPDHPPAEGDVAELSGLDFVRELDRVGSGEVVLFVRLPQEGQRLCVQTTFFSGRA